MVVMTMRLKNQVSPPSKPMTTPAAIMTAAVMSVERTRRFRSAAPSARSSRRMK